jgi:hypothetical protein
VAKKDEIQLIAYTIWEQEGCIDGKDCEHWFRAEAIWEEQQKPLKKSGTKKTDSRTPDVLITPPPNRIELLSPPPGKKTTRTKHKKK